MAAAKGKYFIQEKLNEVAPHHESYKQLWETKWKKPVSTHTGFCADVCMQSWC